MTGDIDSRTFRLDDDDYGDVVESAFDEALGQWDHATEVQRATVIELLVHVAAIIYYYDENRVGGLESTFDIQIPNRDMGCAFESAANMLRAIKETD